ncbi:MAG: transferase [Alphaproteobacteria bacterium]|nr:transferase [Alphaproteobacteria bacterium]
MGRGGITLGEHVVLSPGAVVTSDSLVYSNYTMPRPHNSAPVVLEDGVWVCANAVILPGVTVGKNSVVAAGSVVTKNVPANVLVAGVPAVIRKQIS